MPPGGLSSRDITQSVRRESLSFFSRWGHVRIYSDISVKLHRVPHTVIIHSSERDHYARGPRVSFSLFFFCYFFLRYFLASIIFARWLRRNAVSDRLKWSSIIHHTYLSEERQRPAVIYRELSRKTTSHISFPLRKSFGTNVALVKFEPRKSLRRDYYIAHLLCTPSAVYICIFVYLMTRTCTPSTYFLTYLKQNKN